MSKTLKTKDIQELALANGYSSNNLNAVIKVESGGIGFAADGKLIIQFEPSWFKRKSPYTPSGLWSQMELNNR